ncbi:MAG: thioredoxin [Lachnospiraceae bacterium]|jgi:thioredoxin 1|nr:thioredoxin [Lachnospiraceae bacterium]
MEYKFTSANFEEEVLNSEIPVLVDFYADWCGPCKMMAPIVESLAESFDGKVKVGKLNIDEEMDIAQKYRVMSIPTFIVFKGGQALETSVGAMSKDDLEKKLQKVL